MLQEDKKFKKKKKFKVWAEISSKWKVKWSKIWKYQLHALQFNRNTVYGFKLNNLCQEVEIALIFRVRDPEYDLQKQHQNQIWAKLSITIDKYNKHVWKNHLSS